MSLGVAALLLASSVAIAQSVDPATAIADGRRAIQEKKFDDAIVTLQAAVPAAAGIASEKERAAALAAIHFYTALAFAKLGNSGKATEELEQFFRFNPKASALDPDRYDSAFVALFSEVQRVTHEEAPVTVFDELYPGFRSFSTDTLRARPVGQWGSSPDLQLLGSREEREEWSHIRDDDARRRFIDAFWKKRDATPETEANETRIEFETRVAFADHSFSTEQVRGALSDRGKVFVLLGKPRIVRNKPLTRAEGATIPRSSAVVAEGSTERWTYFASQLPPDVPKKEVAFTFITQQGYGDHIMQRDFLPVKVLDSAAKHPRIGGE